MIPSIIFFIICHQISGNWMQSHKALDRKYENDLLAIWRQNHNQKFLALSEALWATYEIFKKKEFLKSYMHFTK